jgi:hypothetical protein
MNELERAAQDLVANPAASPLPVADIEARARRIEQRARSMRVLSVAAAVIVLLAGVVGVAAIRHDRDGEELISGSSSDASGEPTRLDVVWKTDTDVEALAGLFKARLAAYGATDVVVDKTTPRSMTVSARNITVERATLLLRTKGILETSVFSLATSIDQCRAPTGASLPVTVPTTAPTTVDAPRTAAAPTPSANPTDPAKPSRSSTGLTTTTPPGIGAPAVPNNDTTTTDPVVTGGAAATGSGSADASTSSGDVGTTGTANGAAGFSLHTVGWPIAKPVDTCFNSSSAATVDLGSRVLVGPANANADGSLKAELKIEGKVAAVHVIQRPLASGATLMRFNVCGASNPPICVGLLLDGQLVREPGVAAPPGEQPTVADAEDGFVVSGFTEEDARVFAAVINAGAHRLDLEVAPHAEERCMALTPACTGPVPTTASQTVTTPAPPTGTADVNVAMVYVAAGNIPRGVDGDSAIAAGLVKVTPIPRQFAPATAIQSTDAIRRKVALFAIAEGAVIVDGMFVDPGQQSPTATGPVYTTIPTSTTTADPGPPGVEGEAMVEVYVVTAEVRRGTEGSAAIAAGQIILTTIDAKYRPSTAITTAGAINSKVALFDLAAGTIIVSGMFVGA